MTRTTRFIAAAVVALSFGAAGAASADNHCTINEFGGPRRFADGGAQTEMDLQKVFRTHREDITRLLGQVGWGGNAEDLFGAIEAGAATEQDFGAGTPFEWMMLRYKGVAQMAMDKCWGGKKSFPAWSVVVESNGRRWNFIVPKACGNLALSSSEKSGPTAEEIAAAEAAEKAAREKAEAEARAAAEAAAAAKAAAEAKAKADAEAEAARAAAAAEAAALAAEEARKASLGKGACLVRGFYASASGDDEFNETVNGGTPDEERTHAKIAGGNGFGIEGECLVTPLVGIALGLTSISSDGDVMYDNAEVWEMDADDVDWLALTAGVNFHITKPESKFDLFVGPFLGYVSYDSASFTILDETMRLDFEDNVVFGLQVGFAVPTKKGLGFYGGLRYFDEEIKVDGEPIEFDTSPIVFTAGISYRFK